MNISSEEGHGARQGSSQDYNEGLDMDDLEAAGYETDPGPVVSGRRALPQPPTNVPPPVSQLFGLRCGHSITCI